jgi:hypothetical protein
MGEWRYSSTIMTSVLDGVSGQLHSPAALSPEKEPLVSTGYWVCSRTDLDNVK